jgi:hypothetical protein
MNVIHPKRSTCLYIIVCPDDHGEVVGYWDGTHFSGKPTRAKKFLSYNAAAEEMEMQMMDPGTRIVKYSPLKNQTTPLPWI